MRGTARVRTALALVACGLVAAAVLAPPASGRPHTALPAAAPSVTCADVIVYAVRGSGEEPQRSGTPAEFSGDDRPTGGYAETWDAFDPPTQGDGGSALNDRLGWAESGTKTRYVYELVHQIDLRVGSQLDLSWAPLRYPARRTPSSKLDVVPFALAYNGSVAAGVRELARVLTAQWERCGTQTRYVLAGYSQGADVVYSYLTGQVSSSGSDFPSIRSLGYLRPSDDIVGQLASVELIADPNHDTRDPESYTDEDPTLAPVGGLKAFTPALPGPVQELTDSFCFPDDAVCGAGQNLPPSEEGTRIHSSWYLDLPTSEGGVRGPEHPVSCQVPGQPSRRTSAIECAADRAVSRLGLRNLVVEPLAQSAALPGTTGLDVVFLIDTTGSMEEDIEAARRFADQAAGQIAALDGRVALVAYKDAEDDVPVEVVSGLDADLTGFRAGLDGLVADGGGDDPEGLLHALMTAFDTLDWRPGAAKATVVLTDAGFHSPDKAGETVEAVAQRSLEIDPVNVFPLAEVDLEEFEALADATSGEVVTRSGDTTSTLFDALDRIERRPVAVLDRASYRVTSGREVTFDASGSSADDGSTLSTYAWDFDGDGSDDETTTSPRVTHGYPAGYRGLVQVTVTDDAGRIANASATVTTEVEPTVTPVSLPAADALTAAARRAGGGADLDVTWEAGPTDPAGWAVALDGAVVATVGGSERRVSTSTVAATGETTVSVYALGADGLTGPARAVALPALPRVGLGWGGWLVVGLLGAGMLAGGAGAVLSFLRLRRARARGGAGVGA